MTDAPVTPLVAGLIRVRRRVRALLIADGLARLSAAAGAGFLLLSLLDWWVRFPAVMRLGFLAIGLVIGAAWTLRRVWRPATSPISLDQLAMSLGRLTPDSRDRLASAVAYAQRSAGTGAPELWRKVLDNAEAAAARLPLHLALSGRRPLKAAGLAVLAGLAIASIGWRAPWFLRVGAARLAIPLADHRWPKSTEIESLSGDVTAVFGEDVSISMRLRRGGGPAVRAYIHWEEADGRRRTELMRREHDGVYCFTLERVRGEGRYWFSAGDDDTADQAGRVDVVRRPGIVSAAFVFQAPAYTGESVLRRQALDEPRAATVQGSTVTFELTADKPLSTAQGGELLFENGAAIRVEADPGSPRQARASFVAERSTLFRVELVDEAGLRSAGNLEYRLDVREDEAPVVAIVQPRGAVEATAAGVVEVAVEASDDFGLTRVDLMARSGEGAPVTIAALCGAASRDDGPTARLARDVPLRLSEIGARAGDVVEYHVEAEDNYEQDGQRHEIVRSSVRRIHVVTERQFAERIDRDMAAARQRLRDLLAELARTRAATGRLLTGLDAGVAFDPAARAEAERIEEDLSRHAASARGIARMLADVARRSQTGGQSDPEAARQAEAASAALEAVGRETITDAARSVARGAEAADVVTQGVNVRSSSAAQDAAAAAVRRILEGVERANEYEVAVRTMQDLLDRQEALRREVAAASGQSAGVEESRLDEARRAELGRLADDQQRLGGQASQSIVRLAELARRLQESDPAGSESLARAADAAERGAVTGRMDEAASAIRSNRTNRARESQAAAADALRSMLLALEERPRRELERLARQARDALADIERIVAAQASLIDRTTLAAASESASGATWSLAEQQWTLGGTTSAVARRVDAKSESGEAARVELGAAAEEMGAAAEALRQDSSSGALPRQQTAMAALKKAQGLLKGIETDVQRRIAEQTLAAITAELGQIHQRQRELRERTASAAARVEAAGRVSRAESLRVNRLADDQATLRGPLEGVRAKMTLSVVYDMVCGEALEHVEAAARALGQRAMAEAVREQDAILRGIGRLLEAAKEDSKEDRSAFAGGDGGGESGAPTMSRPIPTLAELKVLRMLQQDVAAQTRALHGEVDDAAQRSEETGRRLEAAGRRQRELRALAEKMMKSAAGGGGP